MQCLAAHVPMVKLRYQLKETGEVEKHGANREYGEHIDREDAHALFQGDQGEKTAAKECGTQFDMRLAELNGCKYYQDYPQYSIDVMHKPTSPPVFYPAVIRSVIRSTRRVRVDFRVPHPWQLQDREKPSQRQAFVTVRDSWLPLSTYFETFRHQIRWFYAF